MTGTWIKFSWASSLAGAITLFGVLLRLAPSTRGLGIVVREGGEFSLKQGSAEMAIPQWLGSFLFLITYLLGFLVFVTLRLSIPGLSENGALKAEAILDKERSRDRCLLAAFRFS